MTYEELKRRGAPAADLRRQALREGIDDPEIYPWPRQTLVSWLQWSAWQIAPRVTCHVRKGLQGDWLSIPKFSRAYHLVAGGMQCTLRMAVSRNRNAYFDRTVPKEPFRLSSQKLSPTMQQGIWNLRDGRKISKQTGKSLLDRGLTEWREDRYQLTKAGHEWSGEGWGP